MAHRLTVTLSHYLTGSLFTLAHWLTAVADHTPIQIAAGCRLHAEARLLLRRGSIGDPTMHALAEVKQAAYGVRFHNKKIAMSGFGMCFASSTVSAGGKTHWGQKIGAGGPNQNNQNTCRIQHKGVSRTFD